MIATAIMNCLFFIFVLFLVSLCWCKAALELILLEITLNFFAHGKGVAPVHQHMFHCCNIFKTFCKIQSIYMFHSFAPPLLSSIFQGGFTGNFFFFPLKSQLRPLATFVPRLGWVGQGAWELCCSNIRKCFFWSDPCVFFYIF